MPSVLVRIIKARNLSTIGSPAGTIDPYVVAKLGTDKRTTRTVKKSLFPVWDQDLELSTVNPATDLLVLEVKDKQLLADKTLGYLGIDLGTLRKGVTEEAWLPLIGVPHGELHVMVTALDFDGVYHTAPGTMRPGYPTYPSTSESGYRPEWEQSSYPGAPSTIGYDPTKVGPFKGKTAPRGFSITLEGGLVKSKSAAMGHLKQAGREFVKGISSLTKG